jgi:3-hydroxybutyryl-CoA dehydrogenase
VLKQKSLKISAGVLSMNFNKSAVIGAGLMGAEIALVQARAGMEVSLIDVGTVQLTVAMNRLRELMEKGVARGFFLADSVEPTLARIIPRTSYDAVEEVSYVTEAVFESLEVKRGVLEQLHRACAPECLIASNTSTIPISTLAACMPAKRRPYFVGTHYFSPVSRMKLVEVIPSFDTSPESFDRAWKMCIVADKVPVRVKDVAGFAVNRMLHAFIIEAIRLVEEDVMTPRDIDTACRLGLGHSMGPFELMDAVTSSLCVQAQEIMQEAYGERFRPRPLLKQRVRAGLIGGRGDRGWLK